VDYPLLPIFHSIHTIITIIDFNFIILKDYYLFTKDFNELFTIINAKVHPNSIEFLDIFFHNRNFLIIYNHNYY